MPPTVPHQSRSASLLLGLSLLAPHAAFADWPNDPLVNLPVCTAARQQAAVSLVSDGAGGAIITWLDNRMTVGRYDVYAQHALASGVIDPAWPVNGRVLCDTTGMRAISTITTDGAGGAIVVWQDGRGAGVAGLDIFAQHVLGNGTLDTGWPRQGSALCRAAIHQMNPVAIADGSGGVIAAWQDQRNVSTADDIYAQHLLASGVVDPAWPADGRALSTAFGIQQHPQIVPSGLGGAIVTWSDSKGGTGIDDIFAQRVLANGAVDPGWPNNGRSVCGAAGVQLDPVLVPDGASGAIVAWDDRRAGATNIDVFAQHVLVGGTVDPAWPADGRALCTAAGNQQVPAVVADGARGAIVGWEDSRAGSTPDVYAQHVLANGMVDAVWPADGRALCTAANIQAGLAMTSDGAAGAIVTWMDLRNSDTVVQDLDLYAQHVQSSGTADPAWPLDGTAVCTAPGKQGFPLIIADGAGGAILAWTDARPGSTASSDAYAQRVRANGLLGGTVVGVPQGAALTLALDAVRPNPWRGGELRVDYSLQSEPPATLDVMDIAGRRVASEALLPRGSGRGSATIMLPNRLAPGIYLVRLVQAGAIRTRRFVVLD